ncbi:hypothetical protein H4J61_07725 [Colwellia sp. MB3u-4]|nr:hypothetical protein [Colwellia sp. MB3u-4]
MKIISFLACVFFLSSCVHHGVQRNFEIGKDTQKSVCHNGSMKDKEECRAVLKTLYESIKSQKSK